MAAPALTFLQKLRYGAEAAIFLAFMGFFRAIGLDAASAVGGFIGRNIFSLTGATRRAHDNLAMAFPEKSEAERNAIIRVMWDNLGRTVAEYAHLDKFDFRGPDPRIAVKDGENLTALRGQGVLILSGHFANWEVMPITGAELGLEGAIVYRPPNNPYVDRYIARARAMKGYAEQISKHHGVKRIFMLLRGGKAILLLADQKTNEGIAVPFLGRDAMTTPAPAALALKLKMPVVLAANTRLGGARFGVTVYPPLEFTPTGNEEADIYALTLAINRKLEEIVRTDPGQWLWIHRRWPTARDITTGKRA
ncbi:MAG TPA: lysophospholipid acyltransferase family protein [Rhizomicrobium sp.]|jgi:KDO2-lipid IV(A) lauroyltransferase|nr:lysophospholipid acyltransferase family protein [Rhizomicrobium sp.]